MTEPTKPEDLFVGRGKELDRFATEVLASSEGQVVIVAGPPGMGKSALMRKMADTAEMPHPNHRCRTIRYEVNENDTPALIMELMIENAFEAASLGEGSFALSDHRIRQWATLFKAVMKIIPYVKDAVGVVELAETLRRSNKPHIREQFIHQLKFISNRLANTERLLLFIDPEPNLHHESAAEWGIVAGHLPAKIKIIFGQRGDDYLINDRRFMRGEKVISLPSQFLGPLAEANVDELILHYASQAELTPERLRKALAPFSGYPFAVDSALKLIRAGIAPEDVPPDPDALMEELWERARETETGPSALLLLEAYAILEVPVPEEVVCAVGVIDRTKYLEITANPYIRSLLREENQGLRLYHDLFSNFVRDRVKNNAKVFRNYHRQAVEVYRARLNANEKPDELDTQRLCEHVLHAEGKHAFVVALANEAERLRRVGRFDLHESLSLRALEYVMEGSVEEAATRANLGLLHNTRGDLDRAEEMHTKALEINECLGHQEGMANNYANLGLLHNTRGDLDRAEEMHTKALEIYERLGRQAGMASQYGNQGNVYQTRGDLGRAEEMYGMALEISKRLGWQSCMASQYGNLGNVYQIRGDLGRAEEMYGKALEISERLGAQACVASDSGNLGIVYQTRGDLDQAEKMQKKALEINERLGRQEGMAKQYGNLGLIYKTSGELDPAEEMFGKALKINERLRRQEGMAIQYGNLGNVYQIRGDLDQAEGMHMKALEICKKLGAQAGVASEYGNLGNVYQIRGDLDQAEKMQRKALEINERLGAQEGVAIQYYYLGNLAKLRGDVGNAHKFWTQALELFSKVGMKPEVDRVKGSLENLDGDGKSKEP